MNTENLAVVTNKAPKKLALSKTSLGHLDAVWMRDQDGVQMNTGYCGSNSACCNRPMEE